MILPDVGGSFLNSLTLLFLRLGRHDVLLLGNVGNSLIPATRWLFMRKTFPRCVLIAHREASRRFVRSLKNIPMDVLAVNSAIARPFVDTGYRRVDVLYGVMSAESFFPLTEHTHEKLGIDFCVLGQLDNAWKGADTAVEAFRRLPERLRTRSRLHMASFAAPPDIPEKNLIPYRWMPLKDVAEFLRRMDIMVVPSRDEMVMRETFSQAMVQGMLTGLPVIANNLPVLTEKIDRGGGLVFNTIDELADAMTRLADSPELREKMGELGRRTALERYVWSTEQFVERYLFPKQAGDKEPYER